MASYGFIGYKDGERITAHPNERTSASFFQDGAVKKKEDKKGGTILNILVNGTYLSSLYVRANLLFIFQTIHLNIKSYTTKGLGVQDKTELLKYYLPATSFGPTVGGLLGGSIATLIGGYQSSNSAFYTLVCAVLTLVFILITAFVKSIMLLGIALFGVFFFASAMFPVTDGWVQKSLPREHAGAGSSFKMFLTNIVGNTAGPIVYGFISDKFKDTNPTLAWKVTMCYYVLGFISAIIASILNYRKLKTEETKNNTKPVESEMSEQKA